MNNIYTLHDLSLHFCALRCTKKHIHSYYRISLPLNCGAENLWITSIVVMWCVNTEEWCVNNENHFSKKYVKKSTFCYKSCFLMHTLRSFEYMHLKIHDFAMIPVRKQLILLSKHMCGVEWCVNNEYSDSIPRYSHTSTTSIIFNKIRRFTHCSCCLCKDFQM